MTDRMRARTAVAALAIAAAGHAACSSEQPGKRAHATRVSTQSQLIGGPKALGDLGDYLLENDKVRFIIHGPGPNRVSTLFPGNLIDADLQRPLGSDSRGNDQLGEVGPGFLLETFNPTSFEVTADGSDGGPAIVTVEGMGGDLLQQLALLNTGLLFPPGLRFRVDYKLAPGKPYLEIVATIINASDGVHPLPYLDPPDLRELGLDIPGLDELELSVPLGHMVILGREQKAFAPGPTGFNLRFSIEDTYLEAPGLPAFPGRVVEFLASRGNGVSYGFAVPASEHNYPSAFADRYEPTQEVTEHSVLLPFLFSAVTAIYHANPPAQLEPGEEFSYTMYAIVGRGDVGSISDVIYELRGEDTGVFAGRVLDALTGQGVDRASVVVQDVSGDYISQYDTDEDGGFRGRLPPGQYQYRVVTRERFPTDPEEFQVRRDSTTSVLAELAPPATLALSVRDDEGRAMPCKITLVGRFDRAHLGRDPRDFLYSLPLGEHIRWTTFDPNRTEFIEDAWYAGHGRSVRRVRPGAYDLYVSRGVEYDLHSEPILVDPGGYVARQITLRRAVDSTGYVTGDMHIHSSNSADAYMPLDQRVVSIAGEGVEYAVATDHNFITDYAPYIAAEGLDEWLVSSVGTEVTSFEMGHFNGYPLQLDPGNTRGGTVLWTAETPRSIFGQLRALARYGEDEVIVQVNHPRWEFLGYFNSYNLDQETGVPTQRQGLRSVLSPYGPEFATEEFSLDFDTVEILNGKRQELVHTYRVPEVLPPPPRPDDVPPAGEILRDQYGQIAFPGAVEDWFSLLNRGLRKTGVGCSDSHKGLGHPPGYPITFIYVGEGKDVLGGFTEHDAVRGLQSRRAIISNGPFVELTVNGEPIGSDVTDTDGAVDVGIRAASANWLPFDHVVVWANGVRAHEIDVPTAERHGFETTITLDLERDTWVVVEVTGSQNMFPVLAPQEFEPLSPGIITEALGTSLDLSALDPWGNLRPARTFAVTPFAMTNPIWIDTDGNGQFDPSFLPGTGEARAAPPGAESGAETPCSADADVRAVFEEIAEVLP